jgi:hypothetical protein
LLQIQHVLFVSTLIVCTRYNCSFFAQVATETQPIGTSVEPKKEKKEKKKRKKAMRDKLVKMQLLFWEYVAGCDFTPQGDFVGFFHWRQIKRILVCVDPILLPSWPLADGDAT